MILVEFSAAIGARFMNYFAALFGVTTVALTIAVRSAVAANQPSVLTEGNDRLLAQQSAPFELENAGFWAEQCRVLSQQHDNANAIAACERAITLAPRQDNLEIWLARSDALFRLQRYAEAIVSYSQVLQITPNHSFALTQQCAASFHLGQYDAAIEACETALRVDGNWGTESPALAWYNRGLALRAKGLTAEALDSYERAEQISPEDPLILAERCQVLSEIAQATPQQGSPARESCEPGAAIRSYDSALAAGPNNAIVWINQGLALEQSGQYERALTSYNQAVQISPNSSQALAHQCSGFNRAGQYQAALTACESALRSDGVWRDEAPALVWNQRSRALIGLAQYENALAAAEQALALNANFAEAWNNKAVSLWAIANTKAVGDRAADYARALEAVNQAVTLRPGYSQAWFNQGSIHSLLGGLNSSPADVKSQEHYGKAVQAYCNALNRNSLYCSNSEREADAIDNSTRVDVLTNLSAAFWHQGSYEKAAKSADDATKLNSESFISWYNLGMALTRLGQCVPAQSLMQPLLEPSLKYCSQAEAAYQRADRLSPNNVFVLTGLGEALIGQRETQTAARCFERALNLEPDFAPAQTILQELLRSSQNVPTSNSAQSPNSCPVQ